MTKNILNGFFFTCCYFFLKFSVNIVRNVSSKMFFKSTYDLDLERYFNTEIVTSVSLKLLNESLFFNHKTVWC